MTPHLPASTTGCRPTTDAKCPGHPLLIISACILTILPVAVSGDPVAADIGRASSDPVVDFSRLTTMGEWVEIPGRGKGWRPDRVPEDWRPYVDGSWTWTREGWCWVSSEPWGWATYRYGRWLFEENRGWVWFPGDTWGPAWVDWRRNEAVVGWAPLAPPGGRILSAFWVFVPASRFAKEKIDGGAVPAPRVPAILFRSRFSRAGEPPPGRAAQGHPPRACPRA